MTGLALIILIIILASFLLETVSSVLNMNAATPEVPEEFSEIYDRSTYANSQVYLKRKTRLSLMEATVDLFVLVLFWFYGGFQALDNFVRGFALSDLYTGLLFIGILMIGSSIYKIPFTVYNTFVLEEEFGFNKTTWLTFISDRVKSLVLTLLLGAPILGIILYFFMNAGSLAWLWAWIAVSSITLILQVLAPTLIMPLFNKFEPLEEGGLKQRILDYTAKVDFPLENLFTMDGSKRSNKSNAFFTGFGKRKRVVLFDTLIDKHDEDELLGIVAHEVGHYKLKHIVIGVVESLLITGIMFAMLGFLIPFDALYEAFLVDKKSVYAGLVFAGFLFSPVSFLFSLIGNHLSRKHEFEADAYAVETTGLGDELIRALKKLAKSNLSNLTPHPFYVKMNYSHPPLLERIEGIRSLPVPKMKSNSQIMNEEIAASKEDQNNGR